MDKNNGEKKKKRENKTHVSMREDCFKSCQKVDVQISFSENIVQDILENKM